MKNKTFKIINIALIAIGAILLFLLLFNVGPKEFYPAYSIVGYGMMIGSIASTIHTYSKIHNMYEAYVYIPIILVLLPILSISFYDTYVNLIATVIIVAIIIIATIFDIHKLNKEIADKICDRLKFSLLILTFIVAALKFVEYSFSISVNFDNKIFCSSIFIFAAIQFCAALLENHFSK